MQLLIIGIHIIACLSLIFIVLLQTGKGSDMGAAFGGSSQTVFGSSGAATLLHKVTVTAAVIFMLTSLTLALFFGRGDRSSLMEDFDGTAAPAAQESKTPADSNK